MPKVIVTAQQRRDRALLRAIAAGKVDREIQSDTELADLLSVSKTTFSRQKQNAFSGMKLETFSRMVRELRFSPETLCEIFGVSSREVKR